MPPQPTLDTDRLILRPFVASDAGRVQKLAGDREIALTTLRIPHPYEDGMAEAWIAAKPDQWTDGLGAVFAVVSKEDRSLVGSIGLDVVPGHRRGELGYWIGKPYWGCGYATEAAREMLRFGFEQLDLRRIQATVFPGNPASAKILTKIGMQREGRLRHYVEKWGEPRDLEIYSILAGDHHDRR